MLWRKSELDRAGGLPALASEPAEDAAATKVVNKAGRRVRLVRDPYPQPLGFRPIGDIWRRQLRWARLRRATFAPLYGMELFSGGFLPLVAAGILIALNPSAWPWLVGLFVAWYGTEVLLAARMKWPVSARMMRLDARPRPGAAGALDRRLDGQHVRLARQRHEHQAGTRTSRRCHARRRPTTPSRFACVPRGSCARSARLAPSAAPPAPRGARANALPRWSWKTGNKTR